MKQYKNNYQIIFIIFIFIVLTFSLCKGQKDFLNPFQDKAESKKGLFNLLDDYPAIKSMFINVEAEDFNYKLGESLDFYPESALGGMRALQTITLNRDAKLRELLLETSAILNRIRTYDKNSYTNITNFIEKIRKHPNPFLENVIPITHNGLKKLYLENTNSSIQDKIITISNSLQHNATIQNLKDLENVLDKIIRRNHNTRQATEDMLYSLLVYKDTSEISQIYTDILYSLGNVLGSQTGYSKKSSDRIIKELIVNLENYATPKSIHESNNLYDSIAAYSDTSYQNYPGQISDILLQMFQKVRQFIIPTNTQVKDPSQNLLDLTIQNFANLGFGTEKADASLLELLKNDFKGRNRATNNNTFYSGRFSALEALAYLVALTKHFGYHWDDNCSTSTSPVYITGESGGFLTLGDSLTAFQSKNDCTDLGSANIIKQANAKGETFKDGNIIKFNINLPALCLLEGNSKGEIQCIDYNNDSYIDADPIYAQTLPWVFSWIVKVALEGEGPFYYDTPTNYNDTWTTSSYKIKVRNGDFAGLGGIRNPSGSGSYYTIKEIPITNRKVNSKEEAFYKNLLWLLYYKRFVIVIPLQANLGSGVLGSNAVQDAIYITIVANGLKGLMNAKPYCSSSSSQCSKEDNGKWLLSKKRIKTYNQIGDLDTTNGFSNVPGDSVILVEVWGCDVVNPCNYGFSGDEPSRGEILYSTVYNSVLFPKNAGDFHGAIPPAISSLFPVMEQLAFITDSQVNLDNVETYWEKRNRLTPLLVSFLKALKDQTQSSNDGISSNDINAYNLMIDMLIPLVKNYIFTGNDPYEYFKSGKNANITLFRTIGYRADNTISIRSPDLQEEYYYPDAEYQNGNTRVGVRSFLSILVENQSRYWDGILPMLAQSKLLESTGKYLQLLGSPDFGENREKLISSLETFFQQMKLINENPSVNEFNVENSINNFSQTIADYPDSRNSSLSHSDWKTISDVVELVWNLLSENSEYQISSKLGYLIQLLNEVEISSSEIHSAINLINAIQIDDNENLSYRITNLISQLVPPFMKKTAPYSHSLIGILAGISKPNGFGNYFMTQMKSSYHTKDILYDIEKLLASNQIQSTEPNDNNILYQTGTLIQYLADIKEQGKKPSVSGYYFEDKWNQTEIPDSYFDRLSLMLTKK